MADFHQTKKWVKGERWPAATDDHPCPQCNKPNRCLIAPDGTAGVCWRTGGGEQWRDDPPRKPYTPPTEKYKRPKMTFRTAAQAIEFAAGRLPDAVHVGTYFYHDSAGKKIMAAVRFDLRGGGKSFRPFHRLDNGSWASGDPPGALPLYRLPKLKSAGMIFVTEGEKAAKAARKIGLNATTSAHGAASAGKSDWMSLAGREVMVLPDADVAGEKYAHDVARLLVGLNPPARVKIVHLPGLPAQGDIVEFIMVHKGNTNRARRKVMRLAEAAKWIEPAEVLGGPVLTNLATVEPEKVKWLWPGMIPLGKLTVLAGDPGVGKSFISLDIAARVSRGRRWPDGSDGVSGDALLIAREDGLADTIAPRLLAMRANLARIQSLDGVRRPDADGKLSDAGFILSDAAALESAIKQTRRLKLIVIDPVSAYLGDADSHVNAQVRALLAPLAKLAEKYRVAIVLISHLNKGAGTKTIYRLTGSLGFGAAARVVHLVTKDPDDPLGQRRLMLPVKNNLAGDTGGLAYEIDAGKVRWDSAPVNTTADQALNAGADPPRKREAESWLREVLANGPIPATELEERAKEAGLSWVGAVRRACKSLGVKKKKTQKGAWSWSL